MSSNETGVGGSSTRAGRETWGREQVLGPGREMWGRETVLGPEEAVLRPEEDVGEAASGLGGRSREAALPEQG